LHGWGGSIESFLGIAHFFCKDFRCILIDFYGFGSSPIDRVLTLQDYCLGVMEVLDYLGIKQAIFVGHSFGGRVGIEIASKTSYVNALMLIDSAGVKPSFSLRKFIQIKLYKIRKRLGLSVKGWGSSDYRQLSPIMQATFVNIVNYHQDDLLHTIHCPTAIVWGKKDKETPMYMARRLLRNIPNARLYLLDGGHWSYIQSLGDFLPIFREWVESVCGG